MYHTVSTNLVGVNTGWHITPKMTATSDVAEAVRWLEDELPLPSFVEVFGAKYVLPILSKRKRGRPLLPDDVRKRKPKKHR